MVIKALTATLIALTCIGLIGCDDTSTLQESADAAEQGGYADGTCSTRAARAEAEARGSGRCN